MFSSAPLGDIAHVIQLAIAPVFLLTAIGTVLNVLVARLGRAVDRRRALTAQLAKLDEATAELARQEIAFEARRIRLIYYAILMSVLCALLVCLLISLAFADPFVAMNLGPLVAVLFILAMVALLASLAIFLREIFLSISSPRAPLP